MSRQSLHHYLHRPITIFMVLVILCIFISISSFTNSSNQDDYLRQIEDLKFRVEELRKIKRSVNLELKQLAKERTKILREKSNLMNKNEAILTQIKSTKLQLRQIELDISANRKQKTDQKCSANRFVPILFNPLKSVDLKLYSLVEHVNGSTTTLATLERFDRSPLLDHSICPLSKDFGFHIDQSNDLNEMENALRSHRDHVEPEKSCLNVTVATSLANLVNQNISTSNNLIVNLIVSNNDELFSSPIVRESLIASPQYPRDSIRKNMDLVIPSNLESPENFDTIIGSMPPHTPLDRKYFASYFCLVDPEHSFTKSLFPILRTIHGNSLQESFLFVYKCNYLCNEQLDINIGKSVFLIILPSPTHDIDVDTNNLLYHSLLHGTIPVIVGPDKIRLPFDEVIDWRRATISIPVARLPELHFILKSYNPADLYTLKYHGRQIFEKHLATLRQVVDTMISIFRIERFNHPPPEISDIKTITHYLDEEMKFDYNCSTSTCIDSKTDSIMSALSLETLGPREHPFRSATFRRNYSLVLNSAYDLWNDPLLTPNYLYPSLPNDPVAPSEYKFMTQDQGFRPIAGGQGGSGVEFSKSLGGDYPNEQFTIVLLTHDRKNLLTRTLERLKGTAYLNKILVVWNGINQKPPTTMVWPDMGVPLKIVKVERNSLNNRFLPFDLIETDAIFSMDDDSPLRPDEIVFAFRVWRQSRDRIVGFPGRFHAWDSKQNAWLYNSNHSCELSMVLTGGAFFHKYYAYMYSYFMPESIRTIVDRFMNCEDIAMNFLVAHMTRKPPIKVTSRWTFHCASCLTSLSEDDSHFKERHECLNMFSSIYGYMPLLNTQHRSDSILFKTRLPKDKQKCFKFV